MRGQQRSLMILLILLLIFVSLGALAKPYKPQDKSVIVASWESSQSNQEATLSVQQRLAKVTWHIQQGQFAGQANKHYGRANALLSPLVENENLTALAKESNSTQAQAYYLWARILQHQHLFDSSLHFLDLSIALDGRQSAALLLKANVLLTQGKFTQSKQACSQLIGIADLRITTACILDVNANEGKLAQSYNELSRLLQKTRLNESTEEKDWLVQLVTDMALRLNKAQEAEDWLNTRLSASEPLANKTLSFIVLWADVQLTLKRYQNVLNSLAFVVEQAGFKDDVLLTRLSLAEKTTNKTHWQGLLSERITLRLARQDTFHSADLARYYLDIQPDPKRALYWAQKNWQQSKLNNDKQLLDSALVMQNTQLSRTEN